ncbi:MAG: hypothetical protein V3R99_11370 [Thermoguttaceae bacterium]
MDNLLLGVVGINDMWYTLPLIVAVSLVYSATRHEEVNPILVHALRIGVWVLGFMGVIFAVLMLISWQA